MTPASSISSESSFPAQEAVGDIVPARQEGVPSVPEDDPQLLECLAQRVGDFVAAWEAVDQLGPPDIVDFLPPDRRLRTHVLVEIVKVDLECRWRMFDLPKRIDEYLEELPELAAALPASLLYEEFFQRRDAGESVTLDEYCQRWPEQATALKQMADLGLHVPSTLISDTPAVSLDSLIAGETIDDFALLMLLGRGAFARVFLARQQSMQRLVALKVSLDKGTEAQTLAQLDHDYIVRVYDQHILPEANLRLLYMQYLPGGTLHAVTKRVAECGGAELRGQLLLDVIDETLESRGEIRPSDSPLRKTLAELSWPSLVAWIGVRLAEGLSYAHQRGVLHRDIKPANVLLSGDGIPKLADFNISFSDEVEGTNPTAYFGGSLAYMSPEHLEAFHPLHERSPRDLDGRADLYSLGILLWELLCGRRPFPEGAGQRAGGALDALLAQRRAGLPADAESQLPARCPTTLTRVLKKCLAADRDDRWRSPSEFSRQLRICLEPRARDLVDPPARSWGEWLSRRAVLVVLLMNLVPNAFAAVGNFLYNQQIIMPEPQRAILTRIQGYVNGIAFPLGIAGIVWLAWRVKRGVAPGSRNGSAEADAASASASARGVSRDCLWLGDRCAGICLSLWTIAGVAYPIIIESVGVELGWRGYGHFFFSLLVCGLIATAYPFFGVTWFAVRYLLPALFRQGRLEEVSRRQLRELRSRLQVYLWMTASIPLLAISGVSFVGQNLLWLVQALCLGGVAAFAGAYWFHLRLEEDLDALSSVLNSD